MTLATCTEMLHTPCDCSACRCVNYLLVRLTIFNVVLSLDQFLYSASSFNVLFTLHYVNLRSPNTARTMVSTFMGENQVGQHQTKDTDKRGDMACPCTLYGNGMNHLFSLIMAIFVAGLST